MSLSITYTDRGTIVISCDGTSTELPLTSPVTARTEEKPRERDQVKPRTSPGEREPDPLVDPQPVRGPPQPVVVPPGIMLIRFDDEKVNVETQPDFLHPDPASTARLSLKYDALLGTGSRAKLVALQHELGAKSPRHRYAILDVRVEASKLKGLDLNKLRTMVESDHGLRGLDALRLVIDADD